jgi:thiamine-phosphate pyrophosphorylase
LSSSQPESSAFNELAVLRILDANFNRASEGLRVVEEYCRFVLDDAQLTRTFKELRHQLATALRSLPASELWHARDSAQDVGTAVQTPAEYRRRDLQDVVMANLKRVEQALRVLEEYGKVLSPELGKAIEPVRYAVYQAAKQLGVAAFRPQQLAAARLYVLVDGGRDLDTFAAMIRTLVDAGVGILQLRDKQLGDRELLARARLLRKLTRVKTLFIMNDRPDLAALAEADGVHVGQEELSVKEARTIMGPRALVGVSTHSIEQAHQAVRDGADYIGCGPTFPSTTKSFAEFPGIAFLQQVAQEISLPAFAIGGITLENVDQVLTSGVKRVAVSGAIINSNDPAGAVRALHEKLGRDASSAW